MLVEAKLWSDMFLNLNPEHLLLCLTRYIHHQAVMLLSLPLLKLIIFLKRGLNKDIILKRDIPFLLAFIFIIFISYPCLSSF